MTLSRHIITGLLVCSMLAALAGCARHVTESSGVVAPEPYAYDAGGRPYYRDNAGRSYSLSATGERQYGAPAHAGDQGTMGYRVESGGIAYYSEPGGRRYLQGERGRKLYVEDRVDTVYLDESGRRYYVDPSGTHHYLQSRHESASPNYVEGTAAMRSRDAYRGWFADEAGRRYYFADRGGSYMVDESGMGYYVIAPAPGGPVQLIRSQAYTSDPREAAMLRCDQAWNECFLRCNERRPTASERCVRNCDRDLDACMGRR